jgi:hypothetical protein
VAKLIAEVQDLGFMLFRVMRVADEGSGMMFQTGHVLYFPSLRQMKLLRHQLRHL